MEQNVLYAGNVLRFVRHMPLLSLISLQEGSEEKQVKKLLIL